MGEIAVRIAIEAIRKALTITADLVIKEGSRLFQLREEISWVEREMRNIHSYLKDVENNQGESERVVNLMTDIRDLAFDIEDTMDKYCLINRKKKGFRGFLERIHHIFSDSYSARNFLMNIEAIRKRVEDINRVRITYGINERNEQVGDVDRDRREERRSKPHVTELNITGFGAHIKNLMAKVHDECPSLQVISIIGMPGLGKTTLAKKVYNSVHRSITLSAWVYVSEKPIVKNILQDIARQVGLQVDKWEDNGEAILYERLSQHRYLIVIDDIWDTGTWDKMKNAIPTDSENCSRIILTSRNRDVGVHIGEWGSLFVLQPLNERYSKQLFDYSMGPPPHTENDTIDLLKIGEMILSRCGGVPLAIVVVAGLLKLKERSEFAWNGVLEKMDRAQGEYHKLFALSYLDLPVHLKTCFLYLGIFPEDHEIDVFDLINLWAAEGFIKGSEFREVEDVGYDYLNDLIARNLVQVVRKKSYGKVKSCRIHDILRGVCIQKAKEHNFFCTYADITKYKGDRVRKVTTHGTGLRDYISSNYQTPKLRSFLCFNDDVDRILLKDFPKTLDYLRVAYFHVDMDWVPLSIFWSFRNLTYLKLQNDGGPVFFPENTIILENLVTLDLQGFGWNFYFPMIIWNMKQLRHLLLPNKKKYEKNEGSIILDEKKLFKYENQGYDPNSISFQNFHTLVVNDHILPNNSLQQFSNLRTLKIKMGYNQITANLLLNSSVILNKLENLRVEVNSRDVHSIFRTRNYYSRPCEFFGGTLNMPSYDKLSTLCLKGFKISQWPQPDALPPNLTKLVLIETVLNGDPLEMMKKIPKLRVLKLVYVSNTFCRKMMLCTGEPGCFSQLEELVVISDDALDIIIEDGGMPKLNKFHARLILKPKVPSRIEEIMTFSRF